MFKVLRYFAFPVSLDHECQNITELAVSNLLSVFAFRFETLAGISMPKLRQRGWSWYSCRHLPTLHKNCIEMGNLLKHPWHELFLHKYLAYHMYKPIPMEEKFQNI